MARSRHVGAVRPDGDGSLHPPPEHAPRPRKRPGTQGRQQARRREDRGALRPHGRRSACHPYGRLQRQARQQGPQEPHRIGLRGHLPRRGQRGDEGANTFHAFRGASYRDAHPARGPRRIDWILLQRPQRTTTNRVAQDHPRRRRKLRTLSERPLSDNGRFQHFRHFRLRNLAAVPVRRAMSRTRTGAPIRTGLP